MTSGKDDEFDFDAGFEAGGSGSEWSDDAAPDVAAGKGKPPRKKKSDLVFYAIIAVIVLGVGYFFILKPKGPDAQTAQPAQPAVEQAQEGEVVAAAPVENTAEEQPAAPVAPPEQEEIRLADTPPAVPVFGQPAANATSPENSQAALSASPALVSGATDRSALRSAQPSFAAEETATQASQSEEAAENLPAPVTEDPASTAAAETPAEASAETPSAMVPADKKAIESEVIPPPATTTAEVDVLAPTSQSLPVNAPPGVDIGENPVPADQAAAQTAADEPQPAAAPVETAMPQPGDMALQEKVETLEKELGEVKSRLPEKEEIKSLRESIAALESAVKKLSQTSAPAPASSSSGTKKSSPARPKTVTAAVKKETQWQLRSAKAGEAWLSPKGSEDVRLVREGDDLPGLGKVLSIRKTQAGLWVVEGSRKTVTQ